MRRLYIIVLLFCIVIPAGAQELTDEGMKKWVSQFSSLNLLTVNNDGSYAAVTKSYMGSTDTLLVFSHSKNQPVDTLIGFNSSKSFVGSHYLFAYGINRAVLANLKTRRKRSYSTVRNAGIIKDAQQYYLVDSKKVLNIYNLDGSILYTANAVEMTAGDSRKILITCRTSNGNYSIIQWNGKKAEVCYTARNRIEKTEIMPSGKYLSIREVSLTDETRSVKILDCRNRKLFAPDELQNLPEKTVKVTEIQNGESFLIIAETHIPVPEVPMVKIWYGTDKELRFTKNGKTRYRFWHLMSDTKTIKEFPTDQFEIFTPLNNSRYLWAFSNREAFNYVHMSPLYNMFLYDTHKKTYSLIFPESSEVFGSKDGRYAVSYSGKEKSWKIYDLQKLEMNVIRRPDLRTPVFGTDHQSLFFSGKTDLYVYDLNRHSLKPMGISADAEVTVINKETAMGFTHLTTKFNTVTVDSGHLLRLQLYNTKKSMSSVIDVKGGKKVVVIAETDRKIKKIISAEDNRKLFTIEENYNLPDGLYSMKLPDKNRKLMYQTNVQDKMASQLKVEVVHFTNSLGVPLKGMLTYPINYDPSKKYPMIVRVYQRQSMASSNYIPGEASQDGFSKRLLIEQGYFVYQPDIVFDDRGTGIASLDCVNAALDAVSGHPGIDLTKVGLTGHSMGGYETDFIATQSTRFAAYISGASVGNTVQKYFSYNTLFEVADYARFENGQFDMNVSHAENPGLYFKNNPINFVQNVSAPMLLWAGSRDMNVVPAQTESFYIGLSRNRKPVIALFYRDQEHSLGQMTPESFDLNRRSLEWWDYFLKGKTEVEWINKEINSQLN